MAGKHFAKFITESAYKTPIGTIDGTTLLTGWVPLDLPDDNAIGVRRAPNFEQLMTAKARGGPDRAVGDTYGVAGSLRGILYPDQAPLLLGWGLVPVDQSGTPDYPWTTSEPNGDLASATLVYGYEDLNFSVLKHRYRGLKAASFVLSGARGTRGGAIEWSAEATGSDEASASSDSEPSLSQYPTLAPYHLSDVAIEVNNVAISNFESFTLTATNTLDVMFDESTTAAIIRMQSRTITLAITAALKSTPDWEALFVAGTLLSADTKLTLTHPGNNHMIEIDLQGAARVTDWARDSRLQARNNQTITIQAQLDRSTAKDMTVAFSDPTP